VSVCGRAWRPDWWSAWSSADRPAVEPHPNGAGRSGTGPGGKRGNGAAPNGAAPGDRSESVRSPVEHPWGVLLSGVLLSGVLLSGVLLSGVLLSGVLKMSWGGLLLGGLKMSWGGLPRRARRGADRTADVHYSTARGRDDRRPTGPWADGIGANARRWGNRCSGGWWVDRRGPGPRGGGRWWAGASPPPGLRYDQPRDAVTGWWRPEGAPDGTGLRPDPDVGDPTPSPPRAGARSGFVPAQGARRRSGPQDDDRWGAAASRMRWPVPEPGGEAAGRRIQASMAFSR
jgi:hypothetical protein